ncbi:MAG: pyridoxal phosphate-dependent aminotransferase, partial [Planctomycetota bacterium]
EDPINLSIGQPHFDTPQPILEAVDLALRSVKNAYSVTQGIAPLREKLAERIAASHPGQDRGVLVTSGTSGGLMLALMSLVDPGDEVVFFDPYFVMYRHMTVMMGGVPVAIDNAPDFDIDFDKLAAAVGPKTRVIVVSSPANPTGAVLDADTLRRLAEFADDRDVTLLSDEIYSSFVYDAPFVSPSEFSDRVVVVDGFSKSHSMTGHRCGWAHGPPDVIEAMTKLQQFTFVCSPHPVQWGAVAALDVDVTPYVDDYRRKRDLMRAELADAFDIRGAGGAFYLFARVPEGWESGTAFVKAALERGLLIIPGNVFSARDDYIRISFAAEDDTLLRGVAILQELARSGPRS